VTRRFPPALGIIGVITAVHGLAVLAPMMRTWFRAGGSFEWMFALLIAAALAQLCAGVAIATSWPHARLAVLAWTLASIAAATFSRDLMAADLSARGLFVLYVEALAAPALAWLALAFAGEEAPAPAIPRARVVSALASTESSGAPHEATDASIAARRPLVGVLLVGMSILGFVGIVLWHLPRLSYLFGGSNLAAALVSEGLFLAHVIAVACLALRAGRRLLDVNVEPRRARNALVLYLAVDVGGDLVWFAIKMTYQIVTSDIDGEIRTMIFSQWITNAILGLVVPTFLWFYVARALRGSRPSDAPAPNLAVLPAWAMLWLAPYLLARVVIDLEADGMFSREILTGVVAICSVLGVLHAVAGSRALRVSSSATRVAYVATAISLVIACGFVILWCVAMFAMDPFDRMRSQMPTAPLAQLVAVSATMAWALQRRGPTTPTVP
jgi:hypothetical protein